MAKKRKSNRPNRPGPKPAATTPTPAVIPVVPEPMMATQGPVREPVFWFGFEVTWTKLVVARFAIFALLAIDAFLAIRHAPRYGAGDFNVGQLGFLGDLGPGRIGYGVGQLALTYLFAMIACGVATRVLVPLGAAIYAWLYFGSQLDSYQHHYLVALILVIASLVPWQRPAGSDPAAPVRTWAVRLLLVQLAIVYLWAAISKLDGAWLDGSTLAKQMTGKVGALITSTIGMKVAALLVIGVELALAATVWSRRTWRIALPLGLVFHASIAATGLEIGLFAFLMLGFYVLVVPDRIWVALLRGIHAPLDRLAAPSWIAWGIGFVAAIGIARFVRVEHAFVVAIAASAVPLVVAIHALVRGRGPAAFVGLAHVLAIALWLLLDRTSDVAVDYYRFWGGSQRRLGNPEVAERAYRRLVAIAPDEEVGHYQLGRILLQQNRGDEGLAELHAAQHLEPMRARAYIAEARYLQQQGKTAEAIEKAKQATYAEPANPDARTLLDSLSAPGGARPPADDSE
ncbi:MAG: HTTM domain-containing protein [Deltaproteobacteria bacterium]|nr:HTTM domain-containing protein [Deltaproteobacteria bacterium]MDQ3297253.1 HTTM domain-containing protein [Myxococcota bacterium]